MQVRVRTERSCWNRTWVTEVTRLFHTTPLRWDFVAFWLPWWDFWMDRGGPSQPPLKLLCTTKWCSNREKWSVCKNKKLFQLSNSVMRRSDDILTWSCRQWQTDLLLREDWCCRTAALYLALKFSQQESLNWVDWLCFENYANEWSSTLTQLSSVLHLFWFCEARFISKSSFLCGSGPVPLKIFKQSETA